MVGELAATDLSHADHRERVRPGGPELRFKSARRTTLSARAARNEEASPKETSPPRWRHATKRVSLRRTRRSSSRKASRSGALKGSASSNRPAVRPRELVARSLGGTVRDQLEERGRVASRRAASALVATTRATPRRAPPSRRSAAASPPSLREQDLGAHLHPAHQAIGPKASASLRSSCGIVASAQHKRLELCAHLASDGRPVLEQPIACAFALGLDIAIRRASAICSNRSRGKARVCRSSTIWSACSARRSQV